MTLAPMTSQRIACQTVKPRERIALHTEVGMNEFSTRSAQANVRALAVREDAPGTRDGTDVDT
jgi:hypothetical protein